MAATAREGDRAAAWELRGSGRHGLLEDLVVAHARDGERRVIGNGLRRVRRVAGRERLGLERRGRGLRRVVLLAAPGQHLDAAGDDLGLPVACARGVVPGPRRDPALDRDLLALAEVRAAG